MKRLSFCLTLTLMLLCVPFHTKASAAPAAFLRWVIYQAEPASSQQLFDSIQNYNRLVLSRTDALAIYGGQDSSGAMIFLEIYPDAKTCEAITKDELLQNKLTQLNSLAANVRTLAAEPFLLAAKPYGTADRVRMARLVIDPQKLDAYKAVLAEEIKASMANEPGVLSLLATTETQHPNIFHLLELYRDDQAYQEHIAGKYFQKYNDAAQNMILEKNLIVTLPQNVAISNKLQQ